MTVTAEVIYGFEQRTAFVSAEKATRGQAKALVAWELGEPFTNLRSKRIWMAYRTITEDEALMLWLDDWQPDIPVYIECKRDDPGAEAYWWLSWPRAAVSQKGSS